MAICVFDIHSDGTATPPADRALAGDGAYRWWHFDLSDADLTDWTREHLPDIPRQALLQAETRPRCDVYQQGLILNLRGINRNAGQPAEQMVSVRMWVTAQAVVTVRVRKVFALDEIRTEALDQKAPATAGAFLGQLVSNLTYRIQDEVLRLAQLVDAYETSLEDPNAEVPHDIQNTRRAVIKLRRYIAPQKTALDRLIVAQVPLLDTSSTLALRELANGTTLALEELNALQERIIAVQTEHDQNIAQRQAAHGYRLSLAAGIFLPLGFLTGLFGVNLAGMPGMSNPMAFIWLCAGMAGLAVVLTVALKYLRWW